MGAKGQRSLRIDTLGEYVSVEGDCWLWARRIDRKGYGRAPLGRTGYGAHRVVYEMLVGPIPKGLTLDHICRVRRCVNPDHLEPVTMAENWRRSPLIYPTHCRAGHRLTPSNRSPSRGCRTCQNIRNLGYKRLRRAERLGEAS